MNCKKAGVWLVVMVCLTVWPAGCDRRSSRGGNRREQVEPKIGMQCVVQFRRDALVGGVSKNPIGATVDSVSGSPISLAGMVEKIGDEWLVLRTRENKQLWIPRNMILYLEVSTE